MKTENLDARNLAEMILSSIQMQKPLPADAETLARAVLPPSAFPEPTGYAINFRYQDGPGGSSVFPNAFADKRDAQDVIDKIAEPARASYLVAPVFHPMNYVIPSTRTEKQSPKYVVMFDRSQNRGAVRSVDVSRTFDTPEAAWKAIKSYQKVCPPLHGTRRFVVQEGSTTEVPDVQIYFVGFENEDGDLCKSIRSEFYSNGKNIEFDTPGEAWAAIDAFNMKNPNHKIDRFVLDSNWIKVPRPLWRVMYDNRSLGLYRQISQCVPGLFSTKESAQQAITAFQNSHFSDTGDVHYVVQEQ